MNSIEESAILPVMSRREPSPGGYTKRVPLKAAACEVVPINSPDWSDFPEASPLAIGRRLWRLRKSEGKSIEAMAGKFGIGRSRWNNWEIGLDRRPETPVAYKIAKYFKVTLEWILFGDDDGIPRRILDDLPQYPNESDDDNSERTLSRP
jgi:transcriptional regulator with XRE-family HTH domain